MGLILRTLVLKRKNYPGIDLGDEGQGITFQVTSEKTNQKIKDTLAQFHQPLQQNRIWTYAPKNTKQPPWLFFDIV